ncbi:MAG: class I SAM-dependent methyltransferase [Chthoniobacterales bacterium]|nr:class I SAM-dependent methyltransferase [Chthoniobacterales bacterium]
MRCENLEALTFKNNTFDLFITQDVFEHIFNPQKAFQEIIRVLKSEGVHIFTTPKHKGLSKSYCRAVLVESGIEYLHPSIYHGSPIGDGRSLVTWDYGDDFEELIFNWSHALTITYVMKDRSKGIDGEYIEVFVTKKLRASY